ncbi:MAG: CPBP family intramembrane metalloprotease [Oscillospiraceae bacterium]|jgi:membrane protease YdiL (CAAX protease family)|nr:CPBP family intramembrane metalloprotease [Oscillospiraceae bacterium]
MYESPNSVVSTKLFTKKSFSAGARLGIAFVLIPTIDFILYSIVGLLVYETPLGSIYTNNYYISNVVLTFAMTILTVGIAFLITDRPKLPPLKRQLSTPTNQLPFSLNDFLIFFVMMYAVSVFANMLSPIFFTATIGESAPVPKHLKDQSAPYINAIYAVIVAPIIEEWTIRGFIFRPLERFGSTIAVVVSAIYFGVMHGNYYQIFYAIPVGLILGGAMAKYHSLFFNICLHAFYNWFERASGLMFEFGNFVETIWIYVLVSIIFAGGLFLIITLYNLYKSRNNRPNNANQLFSPKQLLVNPAFLGGFIIYIAIIYVTEIAP